MRKHWVLITITIAAVLAAAAYFRFFFVFGEGVKSGELNYVVYKGVLFKTYEGKLIQTGIRSKAVSERGANSSCRSPSVKRRPGVRLPEPKSLRPRRDCACCWSMTIPCNSK